MQRSILTLVCICLSFSVLFSQNNRSIDGTSNNLQNPFWGAAGTESPRLVPPTYGDNISTPTGVNRPNPRIISNTIFAQNGLINDNMGLSDYIWVFGQFIDHDIVAIENNAAEYIPVPVNFYDEWFNPNNDPNINIHMFRSKAAEGTGTDAGNPRQHVNEITSWIDASNVYGSDLTRANYLRSFTGGKLRTSTGDLLPWNTLSGEHDGPIDPSAPDMADDVGISPSLFVAGDIRANEQPLLTAFHTLFMREHNRLCDELIVANPDWSDEELYQFARKKVGAIIQAIVYEEWLPTMGVILPEYSGYDSSVDGSISNVFSAAAFRLGHTLLNSSILRMDNNGDEMPGGNMTLAQAFFNPELVLNDGLDPYFKGMATQIEQELDCKMIDDVRNFLFGPPETGAGGLDLAAININRGRERGLPDLNTVRFHLGLPIYSNFNEINPVDYLNLQQLYGDIFTIDPWVGMLAEKHMPDALFGETIMEIMHHQFLGLREGDRFYYENDPVLTQEEKDEIKASTLVDVIMRNTNIELMQENVFEAMDHNNIPDCGSVATASISGSIHESTGMNIEGVNISITESTGTMEPVFLENVADFTFSDLPTCNEYTVTPEKDINPMNGVSTFDLVLMTQHILAINLLDSPYKIIAGDVNGDNDLTTFDLVTLRKLILFIDTDFEFVDSWEFFDASHGFSNPLDPFQDLEDPSFGDLGSVNVDFLTSDMDVNFIAQKMGDVSGNANPNMFVNIESSSRNEDETLFFDLEDQALIAGQEYSLNFRSSDFRDIFGYQFTLNFDQEVLDFVDVETGALENINAGNFGFLLDHGAITTSWVANQVNEISDEVLFSMTFIAKQNAQLSELLSINSRFTSAEAYAKGNNGNSVSFKNVGLQFKNHDELIAVNNELELYQNYPNPFKETTIIGFNLPESSNAELSIIDFSGRLIKMIKGDFNEGYNEININQNELPSSGVYYYQLNTNKGSMTKKMVLVR